MQSTIPIKQLQDTSVVSNMCNESNEPIYITNDGVKDMVIMSVQTYEEKVIMSEIFTNLALSENDIRNGNVSDARDSLKKLRGKFNV